MNLIRSLALAALAALAPLSAAAQALPPEVVAAFEGEWYSFDPKDAAGAEPCSIVLSDRAAGENRLSVAAGGCVQPVGAATAWTLSEGQIVLLDATSGATIAALGGNQFRISGDLSGSNRSILLERSAGDANSAAIRGAIATYRCLFRGFTDQCATPAELESPTFAPDGGQAMIRTLVRLNVRNQPRADAPVIGVLQPEAEIRVDQCLVATDGLWCRAAFGDTTGWFARTALRQDTWPILTFVALPAG